MSATKPHLGMRLHGHHNLSFEASLIATARPIIRQANCYYDGYRTTESDVTEKSHLPAKLKYCGMKNVFKMISEETRDFPHEDMPFEWQIYLLAETKLVLITTLKS